MPRPALLILNRLCRRGGTDLSPAMERMRDGGFDVEVHETSEPDTIAHVIREHGKRAELIVVAGGDGTLNAAAGPLISLGVPMAILPLGTANDLARTLEVPLDPVAAAEVAVTGLPKRIDIGCVNDRPFFNVASIGVSAYVSRRLGASRKRWLGVLGYALTTAQTLRSIRPFRAEITWDGGKESVMAVQIAVGNGRYYGGGMTIATDATIDDRALHLYSLPPQGLLRYAALVPLLRGGHHGEWPGVRTLTGHEFRVTTGKPRPVNTDGEVTTRTPAHFVVLPEAVTVMVPRRGENADA